MKKPLLKLFLFALSFVLFASTLSAQTTYNMCSGGTFATITDSTGTLYDSGGPNGMYQISEDCSLLVAPPCALSITLSFSAFDTESGFDYFYVYDGQTTAAPLILTGNGAIIPGPVTCTSGYMLIVWHSDGSVIYNGYDATWHSTIASSAPPIASFNTSDTNPPLGSSVTFTDQSQGTPNGWIWDFGDGDTAHIQNATHTYSTSGTYYVKLYAFTCNASDTAYDTIVVQPAPIAVLTPDSLSANLACGDSITFQLTMNNTGTGDLVYNTSGSTNSQVRMLALTYGVDVFSEYPSTLAAINSYFTNYVLTDTNTTNPAAVSNLLVGNNVLLLPEVESGVPSVYNSWAYAINNFLLTGGTVIQCGASNATDTCISTTGLWQSTGYNVVDVGLGGLNSVNVDSVTPLTTGLSGSSFLAPTACWVNQWGNSDKRTVVDYQGHDVVSYRNVGGGKAIFIAFDYYGTNDDTKRIIANAVQWGGQSGLPSWITVDQTAGTVTPGGSSILNVTFHASSLPSGTYYGILGINTNDPNNPYIAVSCTLTVTGGPIVTLSDSCVDFGTILENTTLQQTFTLFNSGCDSLVVTGITASLPEYTVTNVPALLLPGASTQVTVTFSPLAVGVYNGSITIQNNAGDTTFCLNGSAGPAPVINTVASVSNQILSCTGTTTSNFSIGNTGGSDLNYTITGIPSWAQLSSTTGTVIAAGSTSITVTFNATGLNDGTYNATLVVTTNDPVTPTVSIALSLTVDGDPQVAVSLTCVNFTAIFEGATSQLTFSISNTGCDTLDVTGLVSSLPEYTTSAAPGNILPGGSAIITVTFHPLIAGNYSGTLLIQNSDVDTTICLTGDGLVAPHINPNTTFSVSQNVPACNGTDSTTFSIDNTGGSDLNFTITGVPIWASLSSLGGTVTAGGSQIITAVMNSGILAGGTQTANLTVSSNDPVAPSVTCNLSMQVGTNPCFSASGVIDACTGIGTFTSTVVVNPPGTWFWDFGDGGTSTDPNPIHQFSAAAGTQINVMLIGCVGVECDTQYVTLIMPLVTGPAAAACLPQTTDPGTGGSLGIGIVNFVLASISNTSQNAAANYQNFTCSDTTTLTCGMSYIWTATTGQTYEETVKGYLDFNNDGAFDQATELIFEDSAIVFNHTGTTITMPAMPPVLGTALRMRVESEYSGNPEPDGCANLLYGQCEDYTVFMQCVVGMEGIISANTLNVYPNPFSKNTTIEYSLITSQKVSVEVFNAMGEKIQTFASGENQAAGKHSYNFSEAAAGIYFVKLSAGDASTIQKLVNMQ
ncbi:MAG: choice-of-anchor D domain-containing protein [Bacteroidota bacterium]